MYQYSIELEAQKIEATKTREYFSEVYENYATQRYRSAVVMLWSVIVADLVHKLDYLSTTGIDSKATKILEEIKKVQDNNPRDPSWELLLIELIQDRTNLIDLTELTNLKHIQEHRHLCAHPVITEGGSLFTPSQDQVRSHIMNALSAVLTKSHLMSAEVFKTLMEEVEQLSTNNPTREDLAKFLKNKYIKKIPQLTIEKVFKSLWRLCFKSKDQRCIDNIDINSTVLAIIFSDNFRLHLEQIEKNAHEFSDIAADAPNITHLVEFLNEFPSVYSQLNDSARSIIEAYSKLSANHFVACWFIHEEDKISTNLRATLMGDQIDELDTPIHFDNIIQHFKGTPTSQELLDLAIDLYTASSFFDTADTRFTSYIKHNIWNFDHDQVKRLTSKIEDNGGYFNQCLDRKEATKDHNPLLTRIIEDNIIPLSDIEKFVKETRPSLLQAPPAPPE